ncbi:hypothetical protein C8Q78DRAFT_1068546 [Trametes maxima]|nr:hypothetical protein C8Q78DRAFT_1068546 [Trametes maxima]
MSWLYSYRLCTFMLALGLGVGATALCLETLVSKAYVVADSGRNFDVLYAFVGIGAGILTTISLLLNCHRPVAVILELAWLPILSSAWTVAAITALIENGRNFQSSCTDSDSTANDICKDAGPIAGLSAVVAITLILYSSVLLFVAGALAVHGAPIWTSSVPRDPKPRSDSDASDVEAKAAQGVVS